jgi:hypothetical protein
MIYYKFFFEKIFNLKYNKEVDETIYYDEECISKCYTKNTLFYNKTDNFPVILDKDKCSILSEFNDNSIKTKECKTNNFVDNIDENDNFINILINNSYSYLNNIYDLKTYDDILSFLETNIKELPLLTQKRILNCIYCAYINYSEFPNKKYIFKVKNILNLIFNLKIHSNKIYNKIIKLKNNNKYKENNDIFQYLYSKFNKNYY